MEKCYKDGIIRLKQNEKSTFLNEINNLSCRVETQHILLGDFHRMKSELNAAKEQFETYINQGKHRSTEISTKITIETKKCRYLFTLFITFIYIF